MATTVNVVVLKHQLKKDGTYNVKIRLTHNRVTRYIDTSQFVTRKQLDKDYNIKDTFVSGPISITLRKYRDKISELQPKLVFFDCDTLRDFLQGEDKPIDFIEFSRTHIADMINNGKKGSANNFRSVVNSLIDFFRHDKVLITDINGLMLKQYERYLLSVRKMNRVHKNGTEFTITSPPLSVSGLHNHMRDLRGLFNIARNTFNNEDIGIIRIAHYPFKSYKLQKPPETKKRNLPVETILKIVNCGSNVPNGRIELARDLFMLSFYMCGTNAVDFYKMDYSNINNGRLEYKRAKTKGKRKDEAFISIKIVEEAKPLLEKYLGRLQLRFSSHEGLSTALSTGMRRIQKSEDIPEVTYYWARHSFATIARNTCRKSKDDIALALNHVDEGRKTTDIYIEKDWKIVDEVQKAVVDLFRNKAVVSARYFNISNLFSNIRLTRCV